MFNHFSETKRITENLLSETERFEENLQFIRQSVLDAHVFCERIAVVGASQDRFFEARQSLRNLSTFIQYTKASVELMEKGGVEAAPVMAWKSAYPQILVGFTLAWQYVSHEPWQA